MLVREFMTAEIVTAEADMLVRNAARLMAAEEIGSLIVTERDQLVGLVTHKDIIGAQLLSEEAYNKLTLGDIMTAPVVTINPEADLGQTVSLMYRSDRRHIPVVDGGIVVGVVTAADIIRVLATVKMVIEAIPERPGGPVDAEDYY